MMHVGNKTRPQVAWCSVLSDTRACVELLSLNFTNFFQSAVGHEYQSKLSKHCSQVDSVKGFGGKFGVQTDRVDQVSDFISSCGHPQYLFPPFVHKTAKFQCLRMLVWAALRALFEV